MSLAGVFALSGCASDRDAPEPGRRAEARAIDFLTREVPAWSRQNGCFSCHNNGDAARALYAASVKGHRIPVDALADTSSWITQPAKWDHNKGDPGFSDKRLANLQFAASLSAATKAGRVRDPGAMRAAARRVAADQGTNGAWEIDAQSTAGSPATYGTALATYMAWRTLTFAQTEHEAARKAERWLEMARPGNVPEAAALLLFHGRQTNGLAQTRITPFTEFIRRAQTSDGGWGPFADTAPEAFDTAIVLLALADLPEVPHVREMIERGRAFLVAEQNSDGSWPATTRPRGGESYAQHMSTTGWATLALLKTSR